MHYMNLPKISKSYCCSIVVVALWKNLFPALQQTLVSQTINSKFGRVLAITIKIFATKQTK